MAKRKKARSVRSGCVAKTVSFKSKRGKVISFPGHKGPDCAPRKKRPNGAFGPTTAHMHLIGRAGKYCVKTKGHKIKKGSTVLKSCLRTYLAKHG